jgi:hypothetical protein
MQKKQYLVISLEFMRTQDYFAVAAFLYFRYPAHSLRKVIPVTGRGRQYGCETFRFPHFLENRLTDSGKVVRPTRRPPFTLPGRFLVLISVRGWVDPRSIERDSRVKNTQTVSLEYLEFCAAEMPFWILPRAPQFPNHMTENMRRQFFREETGPRPSTLLRFGIICHNHFPFRRFGGT